MVGAADPPLDPGLLARAGAALGPGHRGAAAALPGSPARCSIHRCPLASTGGSEPCAPCARRRRRCVPSDVRGLSSFVKSSDWPMCAPAPPGATTAAAEATATTASPRHEKKEIMSAPTLPGRRTCLTTWPSATAGLGWAMALDLLAATDRSQAESAFLDAHPAYAETALVDALRARDFARLDVGGHVYLDYTGGGLYAESQLDEHLTLLREQRLRQPALGQPHLGGDDRARRARRARPCCATSTPRPTSTT